MKKFPMQSNLTTVIVMAFTATFGAIQAASAFQPPLHPGVIANVDVRTSSTPGASQSAGRDQGAAKLKQQVPGAEVTFDSLLGTPKFVRSRDGFLTGPDGVGRGGSALAK